MIRAAPWEVLGTRCSWPIGAAACAPQATAAQAATLAPRPPFNARVETVTTKPFFREPFTGGAIGRKIAAASRRDHLPCGPLQAARGLQRSGLMLARARPPFSTALAATAALGATTALAATTWNAVLDS